MTCLIYTTWPDRNSAETAAETLLEDRLIACANILGESRSIFRWEGKVSHDTEIITLFKTREDIAAKVRDALIKLHPYDEPCVLTMPVSTELSAVGFVNWVRQETQPIDQD